MPTNRLRAFSDGVMAVIITIMVLELRVTQGRDLAALASSGHDISLLTYLLSFIYVGIYVGIYWNSHHHMFQITGHLTGGVL